MNNTQINVFKLFIFKNKIFFLAFMGLFMVYFGWWLAFFPGIMSPDSFDMWREVLNGRFINANPFIYALTMSILSFFHPSPAPMALFQVIVFSGLIACALNFAYKKGLNPIILLIIGSIYVFWPQFGIYNITIWKDVTYAIASLALGIFAYIFIIENKKDNIWWIFIVAFLSALVPLFRFNGFLFLILPSFLFLLLRILNIKQAVKLLVFTLAIYFSFAYGLSTLLKVQQVPAMTEGLMVKVVGGIYSLKNPNLSEFEKSSFENMNSEKDWKTLYDCKSVNILVYDIMKDKKTNPYSPRLEPDLEKDNNFKKAFLSASIKNPQGILKDRICLADNLLGYTAVNNFRYLDTIVRGDWHPVITEDSKWPKAKNKLRIFLQNSVSTKRMSDIYWSTWPITILLILFSIASLVKKSRATLVYCLFIISNLIVAIMLVPAIDYRYVYFVYVCSPLIPIFFALENKYFIHKNR